MKKLFRIFAEEYLPLECPLCGEKSFDGEPNTFCRACLEKFHFIRGKPCPSCGGELSGILEVCSDCMEQTAFPWKHAVSVFKMEGYVKEAIYRFKYRNTPELARALGQLAAGALAAGEVPFDLIVPTPLHWTRNLCRRFNQSGLLGEELSRRTGVPCIPVLRRNRRTRQQAHLDKKQRMQNLHDAFSIRDSHICKGRCILLIDDVMTTGATLSAAAETLLKAGAMEVNVLVLARRQRN